MHRHRVLPLAAIAVTALALTACGGGGYGDGDGSAPAAPSAAADSAAAAPPADTPAAALAAKDAPDLGTIVADAGGFTLYRFDKDTAKPPKTNCVADCATKWPPVVVDPKGKLTLDGVDQSRVGLLERPDGTSQLTIAGWPVYRFAGDADPGATEGQGVGGTWFAVTPDGTKAAATP